MSASEDALTDPADLSLPGTPAMRQLSQRALQAFLITFRAGSISAASSTLNLTQPAISRLLRDLEADLGFPLFHRIRGRLHRTKEGIAFHDEVTRSFIGLERLRMAANNIREGHRYRLVVNSLPAFAATGLAEVIAGFLRDHPEVQLTAQPMASEEVLRRLLDHESAFGIVETRDFPPEIVSLFRGEAQAQCILPPGHRLAAKPVISPRDLDGEVFIQAIIAAQLGEQTARMLRQHRVHSRTVVECRLAYLSLKLVQEGVGLALVDPFTAKAHRDAGGVVRPFSERLISSISIIGLQDTLLSRIEADFVARLITRMQAVQKGE